MAEEKKEDKKTLQQQLDAINFKNDQAKKIKAVQEGKERLKDNLGRNKSRYISSTQGSGSTQGSINGRRRVSAAGNIAGLQTLGNSFGK
jgi:hypothetical protein